MNRNALLTLALVAPLLAACGGGGGGGSGSNGGSPAAGALGTENLDDPANEPIVKNNFFTNIELNPNFVTSTQNNLGRTAFYSSGKGPPHRPKTAHTLKKTSGRSPPRFFSGPPRVSPLGCRGLLEE